MLKMQHAGSGQTIEVSDDMVAMYQTQGWRVVAAPKTTAKKAAKPRKRTK